MCFTSNSMSFTSKIYVHFHRKIIYFTRLVLNYFIIDKKKSIADAFLLGIVIYGVYESTNYAILDKWNTKAVAMDTLWGGILFALTTKATYYMV